MLMGLWKKTLLAGCIGGYGEKGGAHNPNGGLIPLPAARQLGPGKQEGGAAGARKVSSIGGGSGLPWWAELGSPVRSL